MGNKILNPSTHEDVKCMVYTLGTNSWRDIRLTSEISDSLWDYFSHFVFAVPLHGGPPISQHLRGRSLFELQGCFSVSYNNESYPDKIEINIYTLLRGEHGQRHSWVHKSIFLMLKPSLPVFTISFSGEILFKWESAEGNLVFYNQRTKNTWKVENVFPNSHCGLCIFISQVENLSSLKTLMPHVASNICRLAEFVYQSD